MSSPIAHVAAGYAVYSIFRHRLPARTVSEIPARFSWPILAACLSLLPDLDVIAAWVFGNMAKFHNNLTHSLLVWLLASCLLAPVLKSITGISYRLGYIFTLTSCYLHILIDFFTYGRGVMLFWPVTTERFHAPVILFRGVPWSDSLMSSNYLQMLLEDCFFALIIFVAIMVTRKFQVWHQSHSHPNQI